MNIQPLTVILALAGGLSLNQAATLTMVPMQGSMVMPMIKYTAATARLTVTLDSTVPELTPLLVSHPNDHFDPADPWYDLLDPDRQGLAFSRRYGFVMDAATDPLPGGHAIWIRKLSSTPGLGFYRYRSTDPKAWEPIFGTENSPIGLQWNGMMFHPGVAAEAGSRTHSATFEAVLIDLESGLDIPGSGTGLFQLTWTTASDGRPNLEISLKVVISCPVTEEYVLETTDALAPADWIAVTNTPVLLDGKSAVVLEPAAARKFYRMRKLP